MTVLPNAMPHGLRRSFNPGTCDPLVGESIIERDRQTDREHGRKVNEPCETVPHGVCVVIENAKFLDDIVVEPVWNDKQGETIIIDILYKVQTKCQWAARREWRSNRNPLKFLNLKRIKIGLSVHQHECAVQRCIETREIGFENLHEQRQRMGIRKVNRHTDDGLKHGSKVGVQMIPVRVKDFTRDLEENTNSNE